MLESAISLFERDRTTYRSNLEDSVGPAFPHHVQLQTIGGCNAACTMCAMSIGEIRRHQRSYMVDDLFAKIVAECAQRPECRDLSLYLQNEPLLDSQLAVRTRLIKDLSDGRLNVRITTNGYLLNPETTRSLLSSGMDQISVSLNAFSKETYDTTMRGLQYETTVANIEHLLEITGGSHPLILTFVVTDQNRSEIAEAVEYWEARGVLCAAYLANTMGGAMMQFLRLEDRSDHKRECYLPLQSMPILCSGRALLCCTDWRRQSEEESVVDRTLHEVWNSPSRLEFRRNAITGKFPHRICADCPGQTRLPENLFASGGQHPITLF